MTIQIGNMFFANAFDRILHPSMNYREQTRPGSSDVGTIYDVERAPGQAFRVNQVYTTDSQARQKMIEARRMAKSTHVLTDQFDETFLVTVQSVRAQKWVRLDGKRLVRFNFQIVVDFTDEITAVGLS